MRWGDEHLCEGDAPVVLRHTCGGVADPVMVCSHCREELDPHDVTPEPADAPPLALAPIPATGGVSVQDTEQQLWGGETTKAVANFPVSGERVPLPVVRWLGRVKGAAARANAELGLLDAELAEKIAAAADEIAAGHARRAVPHRRVPDGLGHVLEHERQRGARERSPARTRTTT